MNFSVTGEPAPSQLDDKRKQLMQSLLRGGPGAQRLMALPGARQGLVRGYTASDSPLASLPGLTFNPFLAQIQRGIGNLNAPTANVRSAVNDLTGVPGRPPVFTGSGATPGVPAPQPGAPAPDLGPSAPGSTGLPGGPAAAPDPQINPQDMAYLVGQQSAGAARNLFGLGGDPGVVPLPLSTPIQYLRPQVGKTIAY